MNKHTELNKSFDLPGMPGCGARSWSVESFGGQYDACKLSISRPLMV